MWQRFSERARKVVFYAQEEAQKRGESEVSTEHLLLGLLVEPDSTALRILDKLGVPSARIREEILRLVPETDAIAAKGMTLSASAKRVVQLGCEEARQFDHRYVGTEHLLLGLVREETGTAGLVLSRLGVQLPAVRSCVVEMQKPAASTPPKPVSGPKQSERIRSDHSLGIWQRFNTDARQGVFRAQEQALERGDALVSTDHILLALLEPGCAASEVLSACGISPDALRRELPPPRASGPATSVPSLGLSPHLKRAIELAVEESRALSSKWVGSEHLLLGIMAEGEGPAALALLKVGAEMEPLRQAVKHRCESGD